MIDQSANSSVHDMSRQHEGALSLSRDGSQSRSFPSEPLRIWAAELEDFVAQTRLRLKGLSQAVTNCKAARQAMSPEPIASTDPCESLSVDTNEDEPIAADSDASSLPSDHQQVPSVDRNEPADDADPMQRLSAIKLRLAQQIENA